jgi:hypothetical protein
MVGSGSMAWRSAGVKKIRHKCEKNLQVNENPVDRDIGRKRREVTTALSSSAEHVCGGTRRRTTIKNRKNPH